VDPSDPDHFWRDQDVIVRGDIVSDMVTAFDRNFDHFVAIKESRGALNTDRYWQATRDFLDKFGRLSVSYTTRKDLVKRVQRMADVDLNLKFAPARSRFFHNRPRLGESYIQQAYRKLIDQAEREILICNAYFIPSTEFIGALADAAGRGVRVIILTNSPETNDLPELTMVGRSYYKKILSINENPVAKENGGSVEIWEWYGWRHDQRQQTEGTIHAKYAVFDRRHAMVGSYNLDPRSERLNSETAIVFQSDILSSDLAQLFYGNDLAYSRRVTPADAGEFDDPSDALYKLRKEFGGLFESLL
jgi:phosphatidylserine/phosphatidylglycerophosphate/cardiolipin synthase-like enzyme